MTWRVGVGDRHSRNRSAREKSLWFGRWDAVTEVSHRKLKLGAENVIELVQLLLEVVDVAE